MPVAASELPGEIHQSELVVRAGLIQRRAGAGEKSKGVTAVEQRVMMRRQRQPAQILGKHQAQVGRVVVSRCAVQLPLQTVIGQRCANSEELRPHVHLQRSSGQGQKGGKRQDYALSVP